MAFNQKYVYAYICATSIIAILILIYGSIPKPLSESKFADKNDFPTTIDNVRITPQKFYHSHVENLILFVIDGFGIEDLEDSNFDYVTKLIKRGDACFLTYQTQPVSTTLQKIKTLSSGSLSGFAESLLRLGGNKFSVDNIFHLAKGENIRISFHGLNSWHELFPDYINVDTLNNIKNSRENFTMETKNALISELLKDHWDWFIFQYQVSKNSELLFPSEKDSKIENLRHLDEIIKSIHEILEYTIEHYTILILGDSGARSSKSPNELKKDPNILAPYIIIQREPCLFHIYNYNKSLKEIDIAPMISVLTGLPIPSSSYGSIHLDLLFGFTVDEKMYVSYYNTKKLIDELIKLEVKTFTDLIRPIFQKTVCEHGLYLQSLKKNETSSTEILKEYENIMNSLSKEMNDIRLQPNVSIQFLAFILLIEAIVILLNTPNENIKNLSRNIMIGLGFNTFLLAFLLGLGTYKRVTSFIFMSQEEGIIVAIIVAIMICNSFIIAKQKMFISVACSDLISKARKSVEKVETLSSRVDEQPSCSNKSSIFLILVLGTLLQSLSLLEFSFVKCEKWTWFFLWASICFWIIIKKVQKIHLVAFSTNENDREEFRDSESQIFILISILIMHRIILSYTEIEHWLQHSNNSIWTSFCLFFGLMILAFVCNIFYEPFSSKLEKAIICALLTFTTCAIFASKVAEGKATFFYYPLSSGKIESILFWIGYTFGFVYGLVISTMKTCFNGKSGAKELLASGITCCTMLMASQTTTPHVILISMQILYSMALTDVLQNYYRSYILSHVWLGHLFFHYQNYVLSLDNMELTIGTLSSLDYYSVLSGLLKILNIFSAPILSYLLCIHGLLNNNSKTRASENVSRINKTYTCCQLMLIITYALGMMFRSQNDWSWNVLFLKFLYEVVKADLLIIISLGVQAVTSLHDIILGPSLSPGNV
ncbi:GPI ethanolamine phosphate transferase 2-like isoform X2 [Belonocnema kinseyi]|uniref:GPI ethanolamine phosphate transferase 2-like isoform X2 n=1 Tax=Belonocnema kinseyi TaxID=2817044 RepID=UPI00143DFB04|nr:GPI ethanolamine phosphate transferase 2-like isoform X2 [Belonocnema kinseyi]